MEDECLFCKIVSGDMPSEKIYEDRDVLAFLDLFPVKKGHTLVINKKHTETLVDSSPKIIEKIGKVLPKIAKAIKEATEADGISITQSDGKAAGQLIPHVHFHIIPRYDDDGLKLWPQGKYKDGEMEEFAKKIKDLI